MVSKILTFSTIGDSREKGNLNLFPDLPRVSFVCGSSLRRKRAGGVQIVLKIMRRMTVTSPIDSKLISSSPKSRERDLSSIETENFHSRDRDVTDRTLTCKYY